jgi:hypothetical protein
MTQLKVKLGLYFLPNNLVNYFSNFVCILIVYIIVIANNSFSIIMNDLEIDTAITYADNLLINKPFIITNNSNHDFAFKVIFESFR